MKAATKRALEGSIKKWEGIVEGKTADRGDLNCALCKRFCRDNDGEYCIREDGEKCPVYVATGHTSCRNTPYEDWQYAQDELHGKWYNTKAKAHDDETVMCAVLELEFLKSLRPKKD